MNEVLTRAEMESRFDGEWVLVADPELDESLQVLRGQVVYHSVDRDVMYEQGITLKLKHSASLYFGPMPENICINLGLFY